MNKMNACFIQQKKKKNECMFFLEVLPVHIPFLVGDLGGLKKKNLFG